MSLIRVITAISKEQAINALNKKFVNNTELIGQVLACDPTPNKGYSIWIAKLLLNKSIILPEDTQKINEKLQLFEELKKRGKIKGVDINKVNSMPELESIINQTAESKKSRKEQRKHDIETGSKLFFQDENIKVILCNTPAAIQEASPDTWCTSSTGMAESYAQNGGIYFIYSHNGALIAAASPNAGQIRNVNNEPLSEEEIELVAPAVCKMGITDPEDKTFITPGEQNSNDFLRFLPYMDREYVSEHINELPVLAAKYDIIFPDDAIEIVLNSPEMSRAIKAISVVQLLIMEDSGPRPEYEDLIKSDPAAACSYAINIIDGPWKPGEPAIATSVFYSMMYCMKLLYERFPAAEPIIMTNAQAALAYSAYILQHRWKEAEPYIKKDKLAWEYYEDWWNGKFPNMSGRQQ